MTEPAATAVCSTCRFWKPPEQRSDFRDAVEVTWREESPAEREARAARWHALYGECNRPAFCPDDETVSLDDPPPMVTRDGSEYMATLFTLRTFGCQAWEASAPEPPVSPDTPSCNRPNCDCGDAEARRATRQ